MDFKYIIKNLMGHEHKRLRVAAKLTPEEVVRFTTLTARAAAMDKEIRRMNGKLDAERDRLWADLQDKYNLHGTNLSFDEKEGTLYELD